MLASSVHFTWFQFTWFSTELKLISWCSLILPKNLLLQYLSIFFFFLPGNLLCSIKLIF
ncbi:hypothetical protein Patl1_10282 [Pistacia atlantica]|uniref:Uncharacterized protein n=1 Tax=Pistacia atlantica TaxID=434234 RepID=A0ACC1A590_9ROSI|nr:hypothetical protein Patl1_10282 [Pistacia atlantica]